MKEIKLTRGLVTLVDKEDFEYLNQWKWCVNKCGKNFYALRGVMKNKKNITIYMHRILSNNESRLLTDHINGDTLDNRKSNLRICTHKQNSRNSKHSISNDYKGIWYNKKKKYYQSYITVDGRHIYLGKSDTPIEAAIKYDIGAYKYFGEFANLNFKNRSENEYLNVYIPNPEENIEMKFDEES